MKLVLITGLALFGFTAAPASASAQGAGAGLIAPGSEVLTAAAQLRLPASGPEAFEAPAGERMTQASRGNRRQGEILMIVGAAGIVTGLLVDEDLVTIAGAAVGGFGLYLYLEATR
jgi:hypothetical protein